MNSSSSKEEHVRVNHGGCEGESKGTGSEHNMASQKVLQVDSFVAHFSQQKGGLAPYRVVKENDYSTEVQAKLTEWFSGHPGCQLHHITTAQANDALILVTLFYSQT